MGLPSGNRWAVSNLDANGPYFFQESPYQYECSFFSWGNVTPHNPHSDTGFEYNFGAVNSSEPYYEGQPYGSTPGSLLTGDIPITNDAARRLLGNPWHMPTNGDFAELFGNSIFIDANGNEVDVTKADKLVTVNGVTGIYLQSKINGARLFFVCSGSGYNRSWFNKGRYGYYWATTNPTARNAGCLMFYSSGYSTGYSSGRNGGFAIRPIWNPDDLRG